MQKGPRMCMMDCKSLIKSSDSLDLEDYEQTTQAGTKSLKRKFVQFNEMAVTIEFYSGESPKELENIVDELRALNHFSWVHPKLKEYNS